MALSDLDEKVCAVLDEDLQQLYKQRNPTGYMEMQTFLLIQFCRNTAPIIHGQEA